MSNAFPAKVTPPSLGEIYARRRLYTWLDTTADKLVWIEGPPGAGKTTIAASYFKSRKRPVLWYQMDAGDSDPATYFHYLELSARRAAPRNRLRLPALTPEHVPGIEVFAHRYFETLDLRLPAHVAFVFDNVHELDTDNPLHSVIASGLERLNANRTVMLLSRAALPPAYSRLSVNRRLVRLDWQMLRLTEEETVGISRLLAKGSVDVSPKRLHEKAQGWTAGLILMLEEGGLREHASAPEASNVRASFGYFAREVLARYDARVREFLMQTALFPNFSVAMAERLTRNRDSRTLLRDLVRQHRFTEERNEGAVNYQYHPLFREFLLEQAKADWPSTELAKHSGRAAGILEEAGQTEHAWRLYRALCEWDSIVRLVLREAPKLAMHGRFQTLEHWLTDLPAPVIESQPWIRYWSGMCRLLLAPAQARQMLEGAYHGFDRLGDASGLYLAWSAIVQTFLVEWSNFSAIDPWIEQLVELRKRHRQFPTRQIEKTVVGAAIAALTNREMNHPMLPAWLARAEQISVRSQYAEPPEWWQLQLAWYFLWMGRRGPAERAANRFNAVADESAPPSLQLFARLAHASYQWCFGSAELAEKHANAGLAIAARHGLSHFDYRLLRQASYAALARDDTDGAAAYLRQMHMLVNRFSGLDMAFFHHCSAMIRAHQGDLEGAELHAEQALRLARAAGHQFSIASCAYVQLNVALLRDDVVVVEARTKELRAIATATRSRALVLWARTAEALATLRWRKDHDCIRPITRALRISRALRGFPQPWVPRKLLAGLYAKALHLGIEVRHVQTLIRRFSFAAPDNIPVPETWPFAVRIHALGRFSVHIDGKPLAFATKVQRKPLELLKALIALGGKGVREDGICECLWPDAEADAAARALTSTLHRLRKLLGEDIVHRQGGLLTLDSSRCRVDAWMLERLLSMLAGACRGADLDEIATLTARTLESYQGSLLQGESDAPWLLVARERLHAKLLRHVETAARRLIDGERLDQAIGCYRRAIEIDPLNESLYRGLIESYLAAKQPAEALRTFERCRRTLTAGLKVSPSSETQLLIQHLLAPQTT